MLNFFCNLPTKKSLGNNLIYKYKYLKENALKLNKKYELNENIKYVSLQISHRFLLVMFSKFLHKLKAYKPRLSQVKKLQIRNIMLNIPFYRMIIHF